MKKILFLGAAHFQLDPIIYANKKGYFVITCDNQPNNPGHPIADKTYGISTTDREKVLEIAQDHEIDGILTFASDISAPTVAYIADKMSLPGNPPEATEILADKYKFRQFMKDQFAQEIHFQSFSETNVQEARTYLSDATGPKIVKPIDASGSKGVSLVSTKKDAMACLQNAYNESKSKTIIVEDYIKKRGRQICGDGFMSQGTLRYLELGDGHYYEDSEHFAPWGETFPCTQSVSFTQEAQERIEKILHRVGFKQGPFNVDLFCTENNEVFVNEIGPRSGGNYIPKVTLLNTGVDMIRGSVEISLDEGFQMAIPDDIPRNDFYANYMIHSKTNSGKLQGVEMSEFIQPYIFEKNIHVTEGEDVHPFHKGNQAIGNAILKFPSKDDMLRIFGEIHNHFKVTLG